MHSFIKLHNGFRCASENQPAPRESHYLIPLPQRVYSYPGPEAPDIGAQYRLDSLARVLSHSSLCRKSVLSPRAEAEDQVTKAQESESDASEAKSLHPVPRAHSIPLIADVSASLKGTRRSTMTAASDTSHSAARPRQLRRRATGRRCAPRR